MMPYPRKLPYALARALAFKPLAVLALAFVMAAPGAMAGDTPSILPPGAKASGFEPVNRAKLPGERVGANAGGIDPGITAQAFTNPADQQPTPKQGGITLQMGEEGRAVSGGMMGATILGDGPVMSQSRSRVDRLLGDGIAVYQNPFDTGSYSWNPMTRRYEPRYGQLTYNRAYLRYLYRGSGDGLPSVSAPPEMWRGR